MVTLKAPKITAAQRKELSAHKKNVEQVIRDAENASRQVSDLRKKEASLEKEAGSLHHDAAAFHRDAEIQLAATLKQIERVHEAIREAESRAQDDKRAQFEVIDRAHELVTKLCQVTYQELLDQIGSVLAPYYPAGSNGPGIYMSRNTPAVNDLVCSLLSHRLSMGESESIERIFEAANETLRKIDALLKGSTIWSYQGAATKDSAATA